MRRLAALAFAVWTSLTLAAHAQGTYAIYGDYPNTTQTGTIPETLLVAIPVPGGAVGPNGLAKLTVTWTYTNSANTKNIGVRTGTSSGVTGGLVANTAVTTTATAQTVFFFRNNGALNLNNVYAGGLTPYGTIAAGLNVPNINTAGQWFFNLTATIPTAAETVTLVGWTLEIINP